MARIIPPNPPRTKVEKHLELFMTRERAVAAANLMQLHGLRTTIIGEPWDAFWRYQVWFWEKPESRRL